MGGRDTLGSAMMLLLASCVLITAEQREAHLCEVGAADASLGDVDGDTIADCLDLEECDGIDNDGDGEVDEELHLDEDGDGWGGANGEGPCFYGWTAKTGDCDDTDAAVRPDAPFERCDGKSTRCDPAWTEDRDVVTRYSREADTLVINGAEDVTGTLLAGAALTLTSNDELRVCPRTQGAWPAEIATDVLAEDVRIIGVLPGDDCTNTGGAPLPALSGEELRTVMTFVEGSDLVVEIDCLGITGAGIIDGPGSGVLVGEDVELRMSRTLVYQNLGDTGGGIRNEGVAYLNEVEILENTAVDAGGGVMSTGTLDVVGGIIAGNGTEGTGGGAYVSAGDASFEGTLIGEGNYAELYGAGVAVVGPGSVRLTGVLIQGNTLTENNGAAAHVADEGSLECQTDAGGVGGFVDNVAGGGGSTAAGGVYLADSSFASYGCDFLGNSGYDLFVSGVGPEDDLGEDVTITCDEGGCTR